MGAVSMTLKKKHNSINFLILMSGKKRVKFFSFSYKPSGIPSRIPQQGPWTPLLRTTDLWSHIRNHIPWSFPCDSDTLTASWLLKELTPIMPWEAVLAREGIWLWLRGTLYRASAMSAALFRMISWEAQRRQRFLLFMFFYSFALALMHGSWLYGQRM